MISLLCVLLPPIFYMYIRWRVLGDKIKCNFYGNTREFLCEYFLSLCFLNFLVLAIVYKLFNYDISFKAPLMETMGFAFYYLLLSLIISIVGPIVENFLRFHLKFKKANGKFYINWNLILYVYAFFLFMLNFIRIFDNSFWGDEGFSIRLAKMTVGDMIIATAGDVHPPLYYFLIQLLYHIFGNSGFIYHLSAFLPYTAIMIIGCTVIKKKFGIIPTTVMITMASLMKNALIYNVEVRMYTLASLFVFIAYISFYKIIKDNRLSNWIIFCISSLAAAYTHYYALLSVGFFFIMLVPIAILHKKYRKGVIISILVAILGYLPWLTILLQSFNATVNSWWLMNIPKISACFIFLLDYKWVIIFFIICFLFFVAYQTKLLNIELLAKKKLKDRFDISLNISKKIDISADLYWVICGLISICGTMAIGLILSYTIRPLFIERYLFPTSTMLYLIIGFCISKMKLRKLWGIMLVIVIIWFNVPICIDMLKSDYKLNKETVKFLNAVNPESNVELVTNNSHLGGTLLEYYYPNNVSKYDEEVIDHLDTNYNDIWLIWEEELDESNKDNIQKQYYISTKIYEGFFANGVFYYVYELQKSN